jgi:hypothetical protein
VSFYLDNLPRPDARVYSAAECNAIAFELHSVAIAVRDQAQRWRDEAQPGSDIAAAQMVEFGDKVQERASWFRFFAEKRSAKGV